MSYNSKQPKWLKDHPKDLIFKLDLIKDVNSHLSSQSNIELENIHGAIWYRPTDQGFEIDHLEIPKSQRGQGYGKKLLLAFTAFCQNSKEKKAFEIWLEVSALNLVALKLYQSVGFQQVHTRPKYYPDLSDALVMTLKLG